MCSPTEAPSFYLLEGVLQVAGGHSQFVLRLSPPIQRPNREEEPGDGDGPPAWSPRTPPPGPVVFCGWSMQTTHGPAPPPDCLPSSVATSLHSSRPRRRRRDPPVFIHRCRRTWARARASLLRAADHISQHSSSHVPSWPEGSAVPPSAGGGEAGTDVRRPVRSWKDNQSSGSETQQTRTISDGRV